MFSTCTCSIKPTFVQQKAVSVIGNVAGLGKKNMPLLNDNEAYVEMER